MFSFFFFNDTATTEIYTLSLHDALPISQPRTRTEPSTRARRSRTTSTCSWGASEAARGRTCRRSTAGRSEEHTSELQSQSNLVCRLLLEKKKRRQTIFLPPIRQPHTVHL